MLFSESGSISGVTPGWDFSPAGERDPAPAASASDSATQGGRLQARNWFALDKAAGRNAFYRFSFRAASAGHCYWWIDFQDTTGRLLPDVNSMVEPGPERPYEEMLCAQRVAVAIRPAFQSKAGVAPRDLAFQQVSAGEAAKWCDALLATLPPLRFEAPADAFARLPRTAGALRDGTPWRVVMLGDSIQNDTFNSVFQALVQRDFPASNLDFVVSVRGSTGCGFYQDAEPFQDYVDRHRPDLLLIGGISNLAHAPGGLAAGQAALECVARKALALGAEVALLSPPHSADWRPFDAAHPLADLPPCDWSESTVDAAGIRRLRWTPYRDVADRCGIAFWNLTGPTADAVACSCKPYGWFNRDPIHNNDRGKQLIGRVLQRFFLRAR